MTEASVSLKASEPVAGDAKTAVAADALQTPTPIAVDEQVKLAETITQDSQHIIDPALFKAVTTTHFSLLEQERLALALVNDNKQGLELSLHCVDNDVYTQWGKLTSLDFGTIEYNFAFIA